MSETTNMPSLPPDATSGFSAFSRLTQWCLGQYKELVAAIRFLSTVPVPGSTQLFRTDTDSSEQHLIIGSLYFPLIGLLIGALLSLLSLILAPYLLPFILAALLVIFQILLTGGLHLDGLMDSCDGLFGGISREHKLEIMRDSRVGSFGVLGGVSALLLKFSLFASLNAHLLALAFLIVLPVARWVMVLTIYVYPSARPTGLGAVVRQTVTLRRLLIAALLAVALTLAFGHLVGLGIWIIGSLIALALGAWITRSLGGLTGDSYGAIAEITEVSMLLLFLLLRSWL